MVNNPVAGYVAKVFEQLVSQQTARQVARNFALCNTALGVLRMLLNLQSRTERL